MWFLEQMDPNGAVYNQLNALILQGPLNIGALRQSLDEVMRRHEALRTNLYILDGQVFQSIAEPESLELPLIDLSGFQREAVMAEAERLAIQEAKKPFDLAKEPLLRARLFKLTSDEHLLTFVTHHAIFDGWSINVLIWEITALYDATLRHQPLSWETHIQYADYALWQRERYERGDFNAQLQYWQDKLGGDLPFLELPIDSPRPVIQSFEGSVYTIDIPSSLADALKALARGEKATLFMALLASYNLLLYRYTGQKDIIVGCPIAGRHYLELEDLIGLFVNTLPMCNHISGELTFIDVLRRIRKTAFEAYQRQDLPFDKLVEKLPLERELSRTPVFQTLFQLRNFPGRTMTPGKLTFKRYDFSYTTAKLDLTLEVTETPSGLSCRFEYPVALFDERTIAGMADHWMALLQGVIADPRRPIGELPMLTPEESRWMLREWNDTKADYPRESSVHRIFEEHVKANPWAVAIAHGKETITYGQLNILANRLARRLKDLEVMPRMAVAVCIERSINLVACELAILKAGGIFVPIDPTDPSERISLIINSSGSGIVLTKRGINIEGQGALRVIYIDEEIKAIDHLDGCNLTKTVKADDPAYIMYTSGSTGIPKGVRVCHRAINRLVINTNYIKIGAGDAIAHISNPAFDASTFEVWGVLLNGARLVIFDKNIVLSPLEFAASIEEEHITTMFLTTQLFNLYAREAPGAFKSVRDLLTGGEEADVSSIRLVLSQSPPQRLIHVYGPTENTTFSTWYHIKDMPVDGTIPIGKPISNTTAYILDENRQPVPVGVVGEIYLGGDGVARGYHDRPDLTEKAFTPDPFGSDGSQLYRTGDLARYLPDGNIRFLGRRDYQVKIRGFRVELDEVKAIIETYPSVSSAIVTVKELKGEKQLVAYLLARNVKIDTADLRQNLRKKHPEYMVPSYFITLDDYPLTSTGKIDYKSLPQPGIEDQGSQSTSEGPRDELERALIGIWKEVLGVSSISIDDNFFDMGGHSLAAVRMFSKAEVVLGIKLPISAIFASPTVRRLAQALHENNKSHLWQCLVPLKPDGTKPSLFCIHTISCTLGEYNSLVKCLNIKQSIYGIQPVGLDGSLQPLESIEAMAAHYIKEIHAFQTQGPYLLMGYSSGGIIAYEMARQLREQGFEVAFLCLIEPYHRNRYYYDWKSALSVQSLKTLAGGSITVLMHLMRMKTSRTLFMPPMMDNITTSIPHRISRALRLNTPVIWMYPDWVLTMSEPQRQVAMRNYEAFIWYFPVRHAGNAVFFISQSLANGINDTALGWEKLIKDKLEIIYVPGDHVSMMQLPNVESLARSIENFFDIAALEKRCEPIIKVRK
jgi:amino acid adenylation domain-containing protein